MSRRISVIVSVCYLIGVLCFAVSPVSARSSTSAVTIWVDPFAGSDDESGGSRQAALRTIAAAWSRIPAGVELGRPYRILLMAGVHPAKSLPVYMERRYGTESAPITIEVADGAGTAILAGSLNIFDVRHLAMIGLVIRTEGDVVHCELCAHVAIRDSVLDGMSAAQETLKMNQSQHIELTGNEIAGAHENAVDFVAVQHGRIERNAIHSAGDWCIYLKGGSADFWIEGNEIFDCGTGGFTAGQGTGFQFMTPPWITYEAEEITFIRNVIHDTDGAGMGVNGGHRILLAENRLERVGARSHLLEITFGGRTCDGQPGAEGRERCAEHLELGGWGTTDVANGVDYVRIPNKDVTVRDNVFANPAGYESQWQHFFIPGPYESDTQATSNAPNPALTDDGLLITGNVIVNGDASMSLGLGDDSGCQASNPTCNEQQIYADNDVNGR
jgi:hypothetical protein